jgi:hypothetical protein
MQARLSYPMSETKGGDAYDDIRGGLFNDRIRYVDHSYPEIQDKKVTALSSTQCG